MIQYTKYLLAISLVLMIGSCKKKEYNMGNLTAPTEVAINTKIIGQDGTHPNGDGSGDVEITLSGNNVLAYHIDYDAADGVDPKLLATGKTTRKYTSPGINTYRITVVAYGRGATATTITKDIQVRSDYKPDAAVITNLTGTGSKTWKVEKDVPGHFGVGPWNPTSRTPEWWSAPPNDKAGCCNCFYTASFTFSKGASNAYTMTVASPDGAFTKTGALAGGLPGIPASGGEACYSYGGGTSSFSFVPSASGNPAILLGGNNTYIGYGAVLKEYEIMSITPTTLKLRVQGTETGNAWYLILKAD